MAGDGAAAERVADALRWLRSTVVVVEVEVEYRPLSSESQEAFDKAMARLGRFGVPVDDDPWKARGLLDYGRQHAMVVGENGWVVLTRGRRQVIGQQGEPVGEAHSWASILPNPLWAIGLLRDVTIWEDAGRHVRLRSTRANTATHPEVGRLRRRFRPPRPATVDCEFDDDGRLLGLRVDERHYRWLLLRFLGDASAEAVRAWDLNTLAVPGMGTAST